SSGWALVVAALPFATSRVLLSRMEYVNNVLVLRHLAWRHGLQLVVLDNDSHGQVDVEHLQRELDRGDIALVALTHVPMGEGMVNPAAEVGKRCRAAGVAFVLDACQSVGQMPLDVDALGCDVLVGTGRKFLRGPRGTALVHVRETLLERLEPALRDRQPTMRSPGGREPKAQARLLESWETSIAGRLGLGRAVDYALELGLEPIRDRVRTLADTMRSRLASVPSVHLHDRGLIKCGIVTFSVQGRTAEQVKACLAGHRINVSIAALPPSTADAVLWPGIGKQTIVVRASVHYYNTDSEIDRLIHALH
ncbi:aminotransferase class V-fold PLP-dependent enzyme, partial [Arthrobacter sp. Br18]|uniref:aminotransferase class V-fold PLP-dependent enzyme n=1 Tax=Arthrobacter sp. Br18 TaxID=1312954 RepID=UPI00047A2EE0